MAKDLTKYHPRPCEDCGHRDMHGEVAGCIAVIGTNPDQWCPCNTYASPRDRAQTAREARLAADQGMDAAQASHAMTVSPEGPEWTAKAKARLDALLDSGREFTAEDVTDAVGVAPSPSAIGGLFNTKAFKSRAVMVRIDTATRKEAHGRPLRVWQAKP